MSLTEKVITAFTALTLTCSGGQVVSQQQTPYQEFKFNDGSTSYISEFVINSLSFLYDDIGRELPMCLMGTKGPDGYRLDFVTFPMFGESKRNSSIFKSDICVEKAKHLPRQYLGMVHNHKDSCDPSMTDIKRWMRDDEAELEMIVCGTNRDSVSLDASVYKKGPDIRKAWKEYKQKVDSLEGDKK